MIKQTIYILFGLLIFSNSYSQKIENVIEQLPSIVEKEQSVYKTPSISIGIVHKDSIVYLNTFGKENNSKQYLIGSLSKSFTALTILKLEEKGILSIDDKVNEYLPWFSFGDGTISKNVTIKNLLNHTSGINQKNEGGILRQGQDVEQFYAELIKKAKWSDSVGEKYFYANLNYIILAFIAEKASGKSFSSLIQTNILNPLGMEHTFASYQDVTKNDLIESYQYLLYYPILKKKIQFNNYELATGYISSNAEDMSIYLLELMKARNNISNTNISKAITQNLFTPKTTIDSRYGMGWAINTWKGNEILEHTGSTQSFNSYMFILPELEVSVIILGNSNYSGIERIGYNIQRVLINEPIQTGNKNDFYAKNSLPILAFLVLVSLIVILINWHRYSYPISPSLTIKPVVFVVLSILLALFLLIYIPIINDATIQSVIDFEPSIGYSLLIIAIGTILISIIYSFIKRKSTSPNNV